MNKLVKMTAIVAMAAVAGCCGFDCACAEDEPNISVFASFARKIARERKIPLAQAANMLYDLGVRGMDASPKDKDLDELAQSKLKFINFYVFPNFFAPDNGAADIKFFLDQAEKYGVPRCMVVPTHFTKGGDEAAEFEKDLAGMKLAVAEAKKRGITVTVEDFGGTANAGSYMEYLKRFLDEIGSDFVGAYFDVGNIIYIGYPDQWIEILGKHIKRLHFCDCRAEQAGLGMFVDLFEGDVDFAAVMRAAKAIGYDKWATVEFLPNYKRFPYQSIINARLSLEQILKI